MEERGETLITVPCWWDGSIPSLASTIKLSRPELVHHLLNHLSSSLPISNDPPIGFFREKKVPVVGELMLPSFVTSSHFNPTLWWMSEKYDGVRAYWNPHNKILYTRHGSRWNGIQSVLYFMPESDSLDGEIWFGRASILNVDKRRNTAWDLARYVIFDIPNSTCDPNLYEDRFTRALTIISNDDPFVIPTTCMQCKGKNHLELNIEHILETGGEGVVARAPRSIYQCGRSDLLHKFKAHKRDQEALVVEIQSPNILLKLPSGLIFSVNESEVEIEPVVGNVVSFSYSYLLPSGNPVEPKVYRIREDVEWSDVLEDYYSDNPSSINERGRRALREPTRRAAGYWTSEEGTNMRRFFDGLAASHSLDPLVVDSWYPFTEDVVLAEHGGPVLYHFNGSLIKALLHVYPDIGLDPSKFTRRYWYMLENRKRVFDNFANNKQFDPLVPDNWYQFTKNDIRLEKCAPYLLTYYYGKPLHDMLADVYPTVAFKVGCFKFYSGTYWKVVSNRKDFFDAFASKNNFDPLLAAKWYYVRNETILAYSGGSAVLQFFGNSLSKALKSTYPQVSFDFSKFQFLSKGYWTKQSNRRRFFDEYAHKHGFDPLLPENWYLQPPVSILAEKGGGTVLGYSGRSLVKSLQDAYPELHFDIMKFGVLPRSYWHSLENRKGFFDTLAKKRGIDPLDRVGWETINKPNVILEKGGSSILKWYNGSLQAALRDVYQFGTV